MKKILFVLLLITSIVYGQEFTVTPTGLEDNYKSKMLAYKNYKELTGYDKNFSSFMDLILTSEDDLMVCYQMSKDDGYKGDISSFKRLLGITNLRLLYRFVARENDYFTKSFSEFKETYSTEERRYFIYEFLKENMHYSIVKRNGTYDEFKERYFSD